MSNESPGNAKEIFLAAIEIRSAADRKSFLEDACAENALLRERVDALVAAHESPGSLLDHAPPDLDMGPQIETTIDVEQPGSQIGPYKLRERLGAGGMGVVWAAEQKEPLRRRVALKVIKPGMDTEQVLARFATEREALTRMDHPNIARVLDAGTTEQGRPYFVMELIRGAPVTEYCDANKMTVPQRLALFTQACKAVQHAHQKGVIHRDIKPSNVLVSEQDGEPTVKVIDFGVAKALFHSGSETSAYSGVFQAIGTLAYMSPEQAGLSVSDVDTRADVYSLGVLLYELITGCTPFDKEKLKIAALDEAFRIIRENDPPKPSTRASSLGDKSRHVTQCRQTDANGLSKSIRGDLDWIVMKCLDKNRKRRYDTPSALAEDVVRFLNDEDVTAHAPTAGYRFCRMLRRNRALVSTITLLFALLAVTAGLGWVSYLKSLAARAADRMAHIPMLLDSAKQREMKGDFSTAATLYRDLIDLELPTAERADVARHRASYAHALGKLNELTEAEKAFNEAVSQLAEIPKREERTAVALSVQSLLAKCADDILTRPVCGTAEKATSLRLANAAHELSTEYDLEASDEVYSALARSQYENQEYVRAISTCLQWASAENLQGNYVTYLILSAASGQIGKVEMAYDWWLASEHYWFSNTIGGREKFKSLRRDAQRLVESSNHYPTSGLTVEEMLVLYTRLVDRYPDIFEMRKYRGYCLIQLGRWQEAKVEFELLMQRGWLDIYAFVPGALLSLFFESDSFTLERAKALRQHVFDYPDYYNGSACVIAAMLADRDGRLADQMLWEQVQTYHAAAGFVMYRTKHYDEAYGLLMTHGDPFPPRNTLSEIIRALIDWERGEETKARAGLARAEEVLERLGPKEGIPRTNDDVGFATSVMWLEPLLLLREAREKIPREPGTEPKPIDTCLYPRVVPDVHCP